MYCTAGSTNATNTALDLFVNCSNITLGHVHGLALVRGVVAMFCFLLSMAAFIFELLYICRRKWKSSTLQRLFFYLTISNVLYTAALSLHVEHYFTYDEAVQCVVCMIVGFSDQYGGSVQLLLTLGIVMKLFHKVFLYCNCCRPKKINKGHFYHHHLKYEALFVVVCFVLPFAVIWVPFRKNGPGGYGQDGPWCWINSLAQDCGDNNEGFLEQLLLWYVPFTAVSFVSLFCIGATIILLIYITCLHHNNMKTRKNIITVLLDMFLLIPFLVVFCCVCLTEVSIVIIFQVATIDKYMAWMIYAIATPIGGGVMPIAFFVYLLRRKNLSIPLNMPDISRARTVRDSERQSVNSYTSQQERPGFLSNSHIGWETSTVIVSPLLGENHQI